MLPLFRRGGTLPLRREGARPQKARELLLSEVGSVAAHPHHGEPNRKARNHRDAFGSRGAASRKQSHQVASPEVQHSLSRRQELPLREARSRRLPASFLLPGRRRPPLALFRALSELGRRARRDSDHAEGLRASDLRKRRLPKPHPRLSFGTDRSLHGSLRGTHLARRLRPRLRARRRLFGRPHP